MKIRNTHDPAKLLWSNGAGAIRNMKISYEWLREYVDTKMRAENLALKLTMAGHEVAAISKKASDFIFDMEITANRPDCLSHLGIAREAAALTKKRLKLPKPKLKKSRLKQRPFKVKIEDGVCCPRYTCRVLNNVKVGPSPKWLAKRIESVGLRPINNVVDVTNFVMLETGQPLHAFDLDKLPAPEVVIRNAGNHESLITLDGVKRQLSSGMLLIASGDRPLAIAGVIGGKETEVTDTTRNILLESAYFEPVSVRRTASCLALSTDSSYRFERGVDPAGVLFASDRAASLICDLAKAEPAGITDAGIRPKQPSDIMLIPEYVNRLLGTTLSSYQIKDTLKELGYKVKGASTLKVSAPTYRADTTRPADLVEEVARIYGYGNIAPSPLQTVITDEEPESAETAKKRQMAKETLVSSGYNEILTYSLINRDALKSSALTSEDFIAIKNPLSKEQAIMRPSLLPGMLKAVSYNISRQVYDIRLFELSNIYFKQQAGFNEEESLVISQYARPGKGPEDNSAETGLLRLTGTLSVLAESLGIQGLRFEETSHPLFEAAEAIAVLADNMMLGTAGAVNEKALSTFDIKGSLFIAEITFNVLAKLSTLNRYYKPLPRFPYSYRDISFAVDSSVRYAQLRDFIKRNAGPDLESIKLLSEYRGGQIEKGCRGLAIRMIFRSREKTLTEEEIDRINTSIREGIKRSFNAVLR